MEELVGEDEHQHHERYGRFVALATVVTTMIAALVAFAQANSLRLHDRADAGAERYGTLALQASAVNRGRANVQLERLALAQQDVRQANNAALFNQYGAGSKATQQTAARWTTIAQQTEQDTRALARSQGLPYICSAAIEKHCTSGATFFSPEQDPRFPTRYLQEAQRPAYEFTALRDASNQAAEDYEAKFVQYAAALTMLAVAVFLFGYSLTPQGRSRRTLYSRVAGGLVLVAGGWALFQTATGVTTPPPAAASAFADGQVALQDGNYAVALADFNATLRESPRFVDAYYYRSQSEFDSGFLLAGSGDGAVPTTAGPASIPSTSALSVAIADDEHARESGSDSATLLLDLGRDLFYRGLIQRSQADLGTARGYLEESVRALEDQENVSQLLAVAKLKLAADELALGDARAEEEYHSAAGALQAPGVTPEDAVAAALTDLNLMAARYPALAAKVDDLRAQLVAAGTLGATTPTGKTSSSHAVVTLGGVSAQPDPGHALYTVSKPGTFDPGRDVLSAQWEYQDPLHGEWAVLPEISGAVTKGGLQADGNGFASTNSSYVSSSTPATCLPPGRYRVELFINGRLSGSATAKGSWEAVRAARLTNVDGSACVPQAWVSFDAGTGADGYVSADGKAGMAILTIPKATLGAAAGDQKALAGIMEDTVKAFAGSGGLFAGLSSGGAAQATPFFMSSDNGQYEQWTDRNGAVLSGVGTSSNGHVYIGIAWGPKDGALAQQVFLSLSPL